MILIAFILIFVFGFSVSGLFIKNSLLERLSVSFPLGIGIHSFIMFIANLIGFPLTPSPQLILLTSPNLLFLKILVKDLGKIKVKKITFKFSYQTILLIILLAVIGKFVLESFLVTTYWPITGFDALAMYDARAKIFLYNGTITDLNYNFGLYPLLSSLSHTIFYLFGSNNPQFIYSVYFLSLILFFYARVRRHSSSLVTGIFTLLLASTPAIMYYSTIAYTNILYIFYLFSAFIYLLDFLEEKTKKKIVFTSLFLGLASWLRPGTEFFVLGTIFIVLFYSLKNKFKMTIILTSVFLIFYLPWKIYQIYVLHFDPTSGLLPFLVSGIKVNLLIEIFKAPFIYFTKIDKFGFLGIVLLLSSVLINRESLKVIGVLLTFLVSWGLLAYSMGAEYKDFNSWYFILYDSSYRIFLVFVPMILFLCTKFLQQKRLQS